MGFVQETSISRLWRETRRISEVLKLKSESDVDVGLAISDFNGLYADVVTITHKLKKLEDFLGVEYKMDVKTKSFIGYKKK